MARHSRRARRRSPNRSSAALLACGSVIPCSISSRVRISRWNSSSLSTSSSTPGRPIPKGKRLRKSTGLADEQHFRNCAREPGPFRGAGGQPLPAGGRDPVGLYLAPELGGAPVSTDPAAPFHPVERRVKRTVFDLE